MSDFATTGEAMERLFYVVLWDEYEEEIESEIIKVANDFISAYNTIGVKSEILKEREIYGLCNLVNNPGYSNEDIEEIFTPSIPILKEVI